MKLWAHSADITALIL